MDLYQEAIQKIQEIFAEGVQCDLPAPEAVTLATADLNGRPSIRTVLLRGIDRRGLVFYTNMNSRKGQHLQQNPQAALCLFWQILHQQITVEGRVEVVSNAEADDYWQTRPRASQIGAWASQQSAPLADMATLEQTVEEMTQKFEGQDVPRPVHWSGYRIIPNRIEFWFRGGFRLHERICYALEHDQWRCHHLNP